MDFSNLNTTLQNIRKNEYGNIAYKSARNFGKRMIFKSELGSWGARIHGIALAHSDEVNKFFQENYGFTVFEEAERCKINDIPLEWVQIKSDERSSDVKTHSLEDRDSTLISSNVSHSNRKYSIFVVLTNLGTENAESIYEQIVELWQKKKLCTISTIETIEDMIITKVSRSYKTQTTLEFEIDFEVLEFAYLMRKGDILSSESTTLKEEQKTGVAGTKTSNIEYKGFLK